MIVRSHEASSEIMSPRNVRRNCNHEILSTQFPEHKQHQHTSLHEKGNNYGVPSSYKELQATKKC